MNKKIVLQRVVAGACLLLLLNLPPALAQKGNSKPGNTVLLAVDFAPDGAIRGDLNGTYFDGTANVRAEITYRNLYLDTNEVKHDGGRRVYMDPVCDGWIIADGITEPIPCPGAGLKDVYLATLDDVVSQDLAAILPGDEPVAKRCAITWLENGYTFHLRWNYPTGEPYGHGTVNFICTAADENGCIRWEASPWDFVGLYGKPTSAKTPEIYLTTANMPFRMILTKLP